MLTVWCNLRLPPAAKALLEEGLRAHRLIEAARMPPGNAPLGEPEPSLAEAEVAFGQPEAEQCAGLPRLAWVQLTSAGYTTFDRAPVRAAFAARGARLATSSSVYDEPCAQHVLAFMLAEARQLPASLRDQTTTRAWRTAAQRAASLLLGPAQSALLVGHGAIGRRLAALLGPFGVRITAVRRRVRGDEGLPTHPVEALPDLLPEADHVVNLLPASESTARLFDARLFAAMKPGACFYNVGRGATVDQEALLGALDGGRLRAAYLDVTDPEPLPPEHPLWAHPRCVITPHRAGGHADEHVRLVRHFLANLARYLRDEPLLDRVL
jgi:phosphoglycerate dehydrogenase-like enzyme